MRTTTIAVLAVLTVLALLAGGCATGGGAQPSSAAEVTSVRDLPARITVTVEGAQTFTWERDAELRVVTSTPPERSVQVLSVGLLQLQDAGDGAWFRAAFDVVGGYDGAGRYVIEPSADAGAVHSTAFLIHARLRDGASAPPAAGDLEDIREFGDVREACTVEVTDDERSGSLSCPVLADTGGDTVALTMQWEATDG